eukprot:gene21867-28899_t
MATLAAKCSPVSGRMSRRSVAARASLTPFERVGLAVTTAVCTMGMAASPAMAGRLVTLDVVGEQSPIHVNMSVEGMTVKPASAGLLPKTGHFHVLVDSDSVPAGDMIPFDENHKHYGKGQLSDDIELSPFANALHESYGPKYATTVGVTVK